MFVSAVELKRENAELIPTTVSLQATITGSIPRGGDYFDYFYYLTPNDLQCYQYAVQNQSYLFPCSFLSNHFTKSKVFEVNTASVQEQMEDINDVQFSFVVDNTPFPSPYGAFPSS